jgi:BolA protein
MGGCEGWRKGGGLEVHELAAYLKSMNRAERIEKRIRDALAPEDLVVKDESAKHAGHKGARPEGETHFKVIAVCSRFEGLSRLDRHRLIYAALREEQETGLHALALDLAAPSELS